MRLDGIAAIGDPCRHDTELQRCCLDKSLTDGIHESLALMPRFADCGFLPGTVRDEARFFTRQIDPGRLAKAELTRHRCNRVNADSTPHLVEVHIAGVLQRVSHGLCSMAFSAPTMEASVT